jgi:hypothetical protein
VKRGFQRLLLEEIGSGKLKFLQRKGSDRFALQADIKLHLFISDSPCGDAAIYELENGDTNFTGAKLLGDGGGELVCWDTSVFVTREAVQQVGQLRTKSGRSNLPSHLRSTSLSCSDKILKWNILGLQGCTLPVDPIRLASIVVSRDPYAKSIAVQKEALERAVVVRTTDVINDIKQHRKDCLQRHSDFLRQLDSHQLDVAIVEETFESSKSQMVMPHQLANSSNDFNQDGKRNLNTIECSNKRPQKVSPCGFCLNWQLTSNVEVLVGGRGTIQGKKPITDEDYRKQASRLCRARLWNMYPLGSKDQSYATWKASFSESRERKDMVFASQSLHGWKRSDRDFTL